MLNKTLKSLILLSFVGVMLSITKIAYAGCEPTYGGGETCIYNKAFDIEKKVRLADEGDFKDKLSLDDDDTDETVEFRIRIKNVGEVEVDNMKMEDFLPDELDYLSDGSDGLTEEWDDFEPGETVTFYIKAKVDENEFDNDKEFEKCVVNKVELEYDGDFEGSDTATVCYGDAKVTELPKTGAGSSIALIVAGFALVSTGTLVKKIVLA